MFRHIERRARIRPGTIYGTFSNLDRDQKEREVNSSGRIRQLKVNDDDYWNECFVKTQR